MDYLTKLVAFLKQAPKWCRVSVPLLLAALFACYLLSSCNVIRAVQYERRQTRDIQDTTVVRLSTTHRKTVLHRSFGSLYAPKGASAYLRRAGASPAW